MNNLINVYPELELIDNLEIVLSAYTYDETKELFHLEDKVRLTIIPYLQQQ